MMNKKEKKQELAKMAKVCFSLLRKEKKGKWLSVVIKIVPVIIFFILDKYKLWDERIGKEGMMLALTVMLCLLLTSGLLLSYGIAQVAVQFCGVDCTTVFNVIEASAFPVLSPLVISWIKLTRL